MNIMPLVDYYVTVQPVPVMIAAIDTNTVALSDNKENANTH
jgi:hypothetical protein